MPTILLGERPLPLCTLVALSRPGARISLSPKVRAKIAKCAKNDLAHQILFAAFASVLPAPRISTSRSADPRPSFEDL